MRPLQWQATHKTLHNLSREGNLLAEIGQLRVRERNLEIVWTWDIYSKMTGAEGGADVEVVGSAHIIAGTYIQVFDQKGLSWFSHTSTPHRAPISSVQSLSRVRLFMTEWTAACEASLSITSSQSLLKL